MVRKNEPSCSDSEDNLTFSDDSDDQSDSEDELAVNSHLFEEVDSDSAPEEIAFKDEKEKSTLSKKRTLLHLKQQKDLIKKRRTEVHARNALQKEEKLKRSGQKLPPEIQEFMSLLSKVDTSSSKSQKKVFETEIEKDDEEVMDSETKKSEEEEFIRLHGSTVFKVKNLKKEVEKPSPMSIEASNFRERALFGKRIRREPTSCLVAKLEKQRVGGKRLPVSKTTVNKEFYVF